ncbi:MULTISPECIES: sigma-54-dependent Fis family transcriptional regulator [Gordonia]|nr:MULTISPECIES: helix-turn-helix domain-containing protein [Gordonia]AZZ81152.1 Fis family transcriptional regulator [Gordonia alkanivorans]MDH3008851.1 helix-turn-helix domain-containing protein [Gordonia alkanivorans]MDH3017811.1 helix-turn-helix domain-containing protein [Gordonia alkanivorans]MDH3019422.1 helix-turn-helix domain-containing protein [Gordonia alkanivorans]MDH3024025.1 helix-turn-helix domain-containing protein [Gordonia alkanivorans]
MCHVGLIDTLPSRPDRTPQRPVIEHSWRRSAMSGVRPEDNTPARTHDIGSADPLLDAARPVLDDAAARLADTDVSLLLVDHECRMVTRVAFGTTVERRLDAIGAAPGVPFGEDMVGTTALGTPAETRGGVIVNSTEHYLEQFRTISCFGQPIIHPATRRLAGIICMSEIADRINPLAVPVVNGIVADIADRLLDRSRAHQRRVLDAFQRAAPRRDVAVAAIGDDLQLTNALAAELLSPTDIGALRAIATDPALRSTTLPLTLVSGAEVEIAVEPVAGTRGAALFRFRPFLTPTPTRSTPVRPSSTTVAVSGEPGTGRTTLALELAAEALGTDALDTEAAAVVVDVADALINGRRVDVAADLTRARSSGVPLVIDGVDLLDDRSIALLTHATASTPAASPLLLVSGPRAQASPAVAALLGRCARRVDPAPLRHRSSELAAIASGVLGQIDPELTLSGPATDALLSQDWPGNFAELIAVLREAAAACRDRMARVIEATDLPSGYRTTSRAAHLSGREQAERAAIVDALDRAGGNKVHAARDLGISRTTLYARMRALGI